MNLPNIHPNLPFIHRQSTPIPFLIQLCISPDEDYAYRTMGRLLSSSLNVCDEFGCNVPMYSLRYQRYRLFKFLLNEKSVDLNLWAKDRQGNSILHYAILYSGNDTEIMEKLIEKYNKFARDIDERNNFGFSPLLLAAFCGRYDLVLSLLTKTDASPFARDCILLKNLFDYIEIDGKDGNQQQNNRRFSCLNSELKRLRCKLYRTIPSRRSQTIQYQIYENFFQTILFPAVQDQSGVIRLWIMDLFNFQHLRSNLTHLLTYLNRRYPRIKIPQREKDVQNISIKTKRIFSKENSKTNLHNIFNLFDPNPRPTVISPPDPPLIFPPKIETSTIKPPITFKRLSTRLTTLAAFSKMSGCKQHPLSIEANTQ